MQYPACLLLTGLCACTSFDATAATNPSVWVAMWAQLLGDIVKDPVAKGRVMVDLLNEPDARGLRCCAVFVVFAGAFALMYTHAGPKCFVHIFWQYS